MRYSLLEVHRIAEYRQSHIISHQKEWKIFLQLDNFCEPHEIYVFHQIVHTLPKRQILIHEAFSRIKNKKFTNDGNLEMKSSC